MADSFANLMNYLNSIFSQLFTKVIVAVLILLIGLVIGRIVSKVVQKILSEIELNNILKKAGIRFQMENAISSLAMYFIYFITIVWALDSLGLTTTVLNMISAAFLILVIILFLLAVKDFIPNVISGLFIYQKGMIKEGDSIKVGNLAGTVKKITLVDTEIKTKSGDIIHIPNSSLTKKEITVKRKP